jgi:hypothetical protein
MEGALLLCWIYGASLFRPSDVLIELVISGISRALAETNLTGGFFGRSHFTSDVLLKRGVDK